MILRGFLVCSDVLMVLSDIHVITYTSPTQCDIDKYYDIAKLSCESCASGEQSLYQVVDSSGTSISKTRNHSSVRCCDILV